MKRFLIAGAALAVGLASIAPVAARGGPARVMREAGNVVPTHVRGLVSEVVPGSAVQVARAHLRDRVDLYGFRAVEALQVLETIEHPGKATVRFGQTHGGVPVFGAQYLVHLDRAPGGWAPEGANGHLYPELDVDVVPDINGAAAAELARIRSRVYPLTQVDHNGLTILPSGQDGVLTYHFTLRGFRYGVPARYEVFVNAATGAVALAYNNIQGAHVVGSGANSHGETVPLNVSQNAGRFELRDERPGSPPGGIIVTHDAEGAADYTPSDGNIATSSSSHFSGENTTSGAVDAHWGAGKTYDFFKALGRDSLDGNGGRIVSTVNAADPMTGGPMFNAFWDGAQMVYGNPDPTQLHPFPADLDVVGHELTHGVIEHSADLIYLNQSGAMNEAYADYFGNAIDVLNSPATSQEEAGKIGEDLCKVPAPDGWRCPVRDLNDGRTTDSFIWELFDSDNGGVHDNSTIYGGALWDIREALGTRADQIVYRALVEFTTPLDDFSDGRESLLSAAQALSASASEIAVIESAFDSRGITPGWDSMPAGSTSRVIAPDVLPFGNFDIAAPDISGSRFVIADYADKTRMEEDPMQIFVGDVSGGALTKVGEDDKPSTISDEMPAISGKKVVWMHIGADGGAAEADIHRRTLGGSVKNVVSAPGPQYAPDVDGRTIVWEDARTGGSDIWMRKGRNKPTKIVGGRAEQWNPQIDGDHVVWWQPPAAGQAPAIGVKNLRTGRKDVLRVPDPRGYLSIPAVGGGIMAWYEDSNGDGTGAIRFVKLGSTKIKTAVASSSPMAPRWDGGLTPPPVVSTNGSLIAYSDESGFIAAFVEGRPIPAEEIGRDVYVVSVGGGDPVEVATYRGDQAYPAVGSGNTVIWLDAASGRTDLVSNS